MADKALGHVTPDFTVKHDAKSAEAARKKLEGLREDEAKLVEQLRDLRREISTTAAAARQTTTPGFSNADGKAQRDATKKLEQPVTDAATVKPAAATVKK